MGQSYEEILKQRAGTTERYVLDDGEKVTLTWNNTGENYDLRNEQGQLLTDEHRAMLTEEGLRLP